METDCKLQQRGSEAAWLRAGRAGLVRNSKERSVLGKGQTSVDTGDVPEGAYRGVVGSAVPEPSLPPFTCPPADPGPKPTARCQPPSGC